MTRSAARRGRGHAWVRSLASVDGLRVIGPSLVHDPEAVPAELVTGEEGDAAVGLTLMISTWTVIGTAISILVGSGEHVDNRIDVLGERIDAPGWGLGSNGTESTVSDRRQRGF